jgi:NAD(P)-dependent dehydrogenase (short-subunit alcohol dehydrogenase family)
MPYLRDLFQKQSVELFVFWRSRLVCYVLQAFVEKFSKDLACEYGKCGIVIQCIMPGYVATNMSKIRRTTWMAPAPHVFVRSALSTIGIQQNTTGYYPHSLMVRLAARLFKQS